jgi:CRISPR-associated protein Cas7/Cst2/DevR subtype I-B
MKKYLTVNFFSNPIIHGNARGESEGNLVKLQTLILNDTARTVISGESLRYAMREEITALVGPEKMFRHSNSTSANSGYGYGPTCDVSLNKAIKNHKANIKDYIDVSLFGIMCADSGNIVKERSNVMVGRAISMTSFEGITLFTQGVSSKNGDMAPYNQQIHGTRYQYHITLDVDAITRENIENLLKVCFAGLRIGGNHARNDNCLVPEAVVWRFYNTPGGSGLYAPQIICKDELDLTEYLQILNNRDIEYQIAGYKDSIKIGRAYDEIISAL